MVNLESDTPYFYWTFDRFEDLDQKRDEDGFEDSVWKSDVIPAYDVWETQLSFEPPEEWGVGLPSIRFRQTSNGQYEHRSENGVYDAVRADTRTHVILTARWSESDFGKGVFIAVFPITQGEKVLLETMESVPIEMGESYA